MQGKLPRVVSVLAAVFVVGVLCAWWVSSRTPEPVTSAPPPAPSLPREVAPATAASALVPQVSDGTRAWSPGQAYVYAVTAEQSVTFNEGAQAGEAAAGGMHISLEGEWTLGVVAVEGDRVDLRLSQKLSRFDLSLEGENALAPEARQMMLAALELPCFVALDRAGAVKLFHFEQSTDELVRGILRSLVANSQFVVRGVPTQTWQSQEADTTGEYVAVYQRQTPRGFVKKKQAYTTVSTPQGPQPLGSDIHIDVDAQAAFELAEDLWPQSLQARERLRMDTGQGMPAATTHLSLALRLLSRRADPSLLGSLAARQAFLATGALTHLQGGTQDPKEHYRQVLGNKSFDDLVKDLRSLPADEKARDDARTRALEQLRALFVLKPEEARKVLDILRSGMDPLAASPMLGALSAASTPEAIHSLVEVTGEALLSKDVRVDAVSALGMAGEPSREGVDALRVLSRDQDLAMRDTATLAFGNAAYQMSDEDQRGAQGLVRELASDYRSAASPEHQAIILRALGNTRAPDIMDTVAAALGSGSVMVREAAVVALRNIPGPEADRLLAELLLADPASEVRRSVVFACGFRPLGALLAALGQALRTDGSNAVRSDIVQLLGGVRGTLPEALVLLRWASQNDPHPEIRHAAEVFVNTPTTPSPAQPAPSPTR